jgi:hypothetical protein
MPEIVHDEVLGPLTWNDKQQLWTFVIGPIGDRPVPGSVIPEDIRMPLGGEQLASVRACVSWLRDNEPIARAHITAHAFKTWSEAWFDPEIDAANTAAGHP